MSTSANKVFWAPGLLERIVSFTPPNDVACNVRPLNRSTAQRLQSPEHRSIHLSQPCPTDVFRQHWSRPGAVRSLNLRRRQQLVALTASSGVLCNLELALRVAGCIPMYTMMDAAAAAGEVEACGWLQELGCPWGYALTAAARAGRSAACEWLLGSGCGWDPEAAVAAAEGGHLLLMEKLLELAPANEDAEVDRGVLLEAAAGGLDLPSLRHVYDLLVLGAQDASPLGQDEKARILAAAAASSSPDWLAKVEWLAGLGYPMPIPMSRLLGQPYAVERLASLRQHGYAAGLPAAGLVLTVVAGSGNGDVLRHLVSEGLMPAADRDHDVRRVALAITIAAMDGHLDALQAMQAAGYLRFVTAREVARAAAGAGHLPVVSWAVEELGYDIASDDAMAPAAAGSGDVGLMSWVRARNQIRTPEEEMRAAVQSGCEEMVELVAGRGFEVPAGEPFAQRLIEVAADQGDLATLRWLRRRLKGALPPAVFLRLATTAMRHVWVLRWLLDEGDCPMDLGTLEEMERRLEERLGEVRLQWQTEDVGDPVRDWLREVVEQRRSGAG